jgi:EmrB/QacA subfamily drug resistance transporter
MTSTTPATGSATSGRAGTLTLIGLILAVSMTTIDQTIVALSAPTIQSQLGLSHDGIQWAVNVYLLAMAAFFLLGGRLADVFGHKRMVLIGIAGFGLTSLLCGLTPTGGGAEAWLVIARALQGISGAIMFPAAIGIVVQTFPTAGRAKAMATFFAITGAMTAVGPIAGGYLTQWTWRSIFWVNIPIAIAAFIIVALTATSAPRRHERIDWAGAALVAVGMAGVVFGLQQASAWGWTNPAVLICLIAGAAVLVLFGVTQARKTHPLVQLAAFRDAGFTLSTVAILLSSIAFISVFFFLSIYGQASLGLSAGMTGLLFLKFFIGFVIASRIGAGMFDRRGAKPVLAIGGIVGAFGFAWLASTLTALPAHPDAFFNPQTWPILVAGAGIGFMFSPASTDVVNRAIGASYGEVSAITQTMKNFGGALGLAVLTTLVTNELTTRLTASIVRLGGTAADAQSAINQVTGGSHQGSTLGTVPAAVREQIVHAVQSDYAASAQWAFYGMAVAMGLVLVLAVFYPRGHAVTGGPSAAGTTGASNLGATDAAHRGETASDTVTAG